MLRQLRKLLLARTVKKDCLVWWRIFFDGQRQLKSDVACRALGLEGSLLPEMTALLSLKKSKASLARGAAEAR